MAHTSIYFTIDSARIRQYPHGDQPQAFDNRET
jgi:hypothetical protein